MAGGGRIQPRARPLRLRRRGRGGRRASCKTQGAPQYLDAITADDDEDGEDGDGRATRRRRPGRFATTSTTRRWPWCSRDGKASTSYIQRRLQIGYNRAASIIERMEKEGLVGPANHAGKREILVPTEDDILAR
ncbi:MAG: DNA translocase FtsK [Dermatophilaceae bacterium]